MIANAFQRRAQWLPEPARYDWIMDQAATRGAESPWPLETIEADIKALESDIVSIPGEITSGGRP